MYAWAEVKGETVPKVLCLTWKKYCLQVNGGSLCTIE